MIRKYVHTGQLVIQTNKAKQTQFKANSNPIYQRPKMMQSVYLQRIMKIYVDMGPKKQTQKQSQFKPNLSKGQK
jgi:hypothetical protein